MQIDNSVFLDAIRATLPNGGNVSENALTLNEIMELTGLSRDKARQTIGTYIKENKVGITKVWRESTLGGYRARYPGYYYKGQRDGQNLEFNNSAYISS